MNAVDRSNLETNNSTTELVSLYLGMNNEVIIGDNGVCPNRLVHANIPIENAESWKTYYEERNA